MNNLADKQPTKAAELAGKYEQWARRCNVVPWDQVKP